MKYIYVTLTLLLFFCLPAKAQTFPGFSKLYKYSGDTFLRNESLSCLIFDTIHQSIFFAAGGFLSTPTGSVSVFATLYKTDLQGNLLKEIMDSVSEGGVGYQCVTESKDGKYLYWGGFSFVYNDSTNIYWKVRKTDKYLNIIWDKLYHGNAASNNNFNIKELNDRSLSLLCFSYTSTSTPGFPVKPSTISLKKIDSMGNLLSESFPVSWPYTNGYGLEFTNDGGYMINGGSNNKAYTLKVDSTYQYQTHQFYATDVRSWFNSIRKQNGSEEAYLNAGGTIQGGLGYGLATKTDADGNELWQKRISLNHDTEELYDVANGSNKSALFVGTSFFPNSQDAARGWMTKLDNDGNVIWNKFYSTPHPEEYHDYIWKVIPMPDGGFLAAGSTFGQEPNGRWSQYGWLLRVDSNGCYNPECSSFTAIKDIKAAKEPISIFPNPSPGMIHVRSQSAFPKGTQLTLVDISGKTVKSLESPEGKTQMVYNLKGLLPGIYVLKFEMNGEILQKKIVINF